MLHRLILQLRTVRYLKPRQIYYYVLRRYLPPRFVRISTTPSLRNSLPSNPPCVTSGVYVNDSTFRFLNIEADLSHSETAVDWSAQLQSRLWQYNLHYFDYLRESARPAHNKDQLIQSWIEGNPQGSEPGWEPFTTSLRIVNWIFYTLQRPPEDIPPAWLDSLYLQTLWLERNDEKHILANHYFENLKALFFAGCFFEGDDANRWINRILKEIPNQAHEQTLSDGGHYERSHLYHCLMLENYLDIYNLSQSYLELCTSDFVEQVRSSAMRSLEWLAATLFSDGMIPLFNDSAFGVSILPRELFSYAERLSLNVDHGKFEKIELIDRPASGLYGCRIGDDMFIIDCGDIGPSYQPGHTHCDFLSYELMLAARRVVVDTGVCEYQPGPMRSYVRSTKAHNTVSVDGGEQSEIWGQFRVARRAEKIGAKISLCDNMVEFCGAYRGFCTIRNRIEHERTVAILLCPNDKKFRELIITDCLSGVGQHVAENFIHIHPEIDVRCSHDGGINLIHDESAIASIQLSDDQHYQIESGIYCPEFGKQIPNQVIVLRTQGNLPFSQCYKIQIKIC